MIPKLDAVDSTNILALGYDEESRCFGVRFHSSPEFVYVYSDVPKQIALTVVDAEGAGVSVGFAFSTMIKKGGFKFEKKPWLPELIKAPESIADAIVSFVEAPKATFVNDDTDLMSLSGHKSTTLLEAASIVANHPISKVKK